MRTLVQVIKDRIQTRQCVDKYHRNKEWVLFALLVWIVVFLTTWSGYVNYKLSELEYHTKLHEKFNQTIFETQLLILEDLRTANPALHERAIQKLSELNDLLKEHQKNQ